ncbi:MAG: hypothetical protein ABF334_04510 [Akkermansiaceae bacterium]
MKQFLQACLCMVMMSLLMMAQEYRSPEVTVSCFKGNLMMLDREREKLAKNIAIYAGNRVADDKGRNHSLAIARRLLGFSLHLAPKNATASALDRRLNDGEVPPKENAEYGDETFSELLFTKGKELQKGSKEDALLSACLIELSTMVNPKNKAAVKALELQRIQRGTVDWTIFTGS